MALSAANVRVAVTGALYVDSAGSATPPTDAAAALTGFDDLGYVSEDGVTLTFPEAGDSTPIRAWQNGATVRTVRSTSDELPSLALTLIETKLEVIETVFGVTVTQTASDGSFVIDSTATRAALPIVLDVVDDAEIIRIYAPAAVVTSIGEIALTSTDAIGYNVTFELDRDSTLGGNAKTFMTALKTP